MFKSDSQSKDIFKISFNIQYKDINIFEEFFTEKVSAISVYEVKSKTLESQPKDIWCFEIYCDNQTNLVTLKKEVQELAKLNNIEINSDIISEEIEDKDWVAFYQNQLAPIQTNRFFICTTLHQDKCPKDKTLILIEASRAFGTGTHETTSGCIEALECLKDIKANKILDIGTGSGILSFIAEKLWNEAEILACDIDNASVEIAKENASFNNSNIKFYQNTSENILLGNYYNSKFDLVISNILALPLIELSTQISNLMNKNGYLVLSGFLDNQLEDVRDAYEKIGFEVKEIIYKNSWVILIAAYYK
ncbi:MAG TPA: 50S ribosomal protein L11 methyltransferase [Rickettsia endosymbiont of Bembidion lapponicum]|nr:50S ribosomal protein L11 methyltransferase [Rickettsia endosymbiont of Bembidion lapponicum]